MHIVQSAPSAEVRIVQSAPRVRSARTRGGIWCTAVNAHCRDVRCDYITWMVSYTSTLPPPAITGEPLASSAAAARSSAAMTE